MNMKWFCEFFGQNIFLRRLAGLALVLILLVLAKGPPGLAVASSLASPDNLGTDLTNNISSDECLTLVPDPSIPKFQVPITCDVPVAASIDNPAETDLFSFDVTDGEIVAITVVETPSGQNFTPYWRLLDGTGNPALACGSLTTTAQRDCGPLPASGNPYRIEVRDFGNDDTGIYSVSRCLFRIYLPVILLRN